MKPKIPEKKKRTGIFYAQTVDGIELPVIDIGHPAFTLAKPQGDEMAALIAAGAAAQARYNHMPAFVRKMVMGMTVRRSILMRGLRESAGTFISGMNTYLLKLGAENLGTAYASKVDRAIAASIPALSARWRLQDTVQLLVDGLVPLLSARADRPLHFINIAGGPCMDSLNTLIRIQQVRPRLLEQRVIAIHVFDMEEPGPLFARSALEALQGASGPLHGLSITLEHIPYDWSKPETLQEQLLDMDLANAMAAISSEGGLFNYGTDEDIAGNLRVLHAHTPADAVLVGTITLAEGAGRVFKQMSKITTIPRTPGDFAALARQTGWEVWASLEQPISRAIGMRKA